MKVTKERGRSGGRQSGEASGTGYPFGVPCSASAQARLVSAANQVFLKPAELVQLAVWHFIGQIETTGHMLMKSYSRPGLGGCSCRDRACCEKVNLRPFGCLFAEDRDRLTAAARKVFLPEEELVRVAVFQCVGQIETTKELKLRGFRLLWKD